MLSLPRRLLVATTSRRPQRAWGLSPTLGCLTPAVAVARRPRRSPAVDTTPIGVTDEDMTALMHFAGAGRGVAGSAGTATRTVADRPTLPSSTSVGKRRSSGSKKTSRGARSKAPAGDAVEAIEDVASFDSGRSSSNRLIQPPSSKPAREERPPSRPAPPDVASVSSTNNVLTNPFGGLHSSIARSYRLEQLAEGATPADLLLGRQEKKSGAFSFLRFQSSGMNFHTSHWESWPQLRETNAALVAASRARRAVPGFTLFNNDLGVDKDALAHDAGLLLAQRLLLFPDAMRHFHALCGRENVPCDFYADVDLPGESPDEGERLLLEILTYLEVRLPGVGFTDPFFLILSNETPSRDKVSYHIHARSMSVLQECRDAIGERRRGGGGAAAPRKARPRRKTAVAATRTSDSGPLESADADVDDDDAVNVVGSATSATPRLIAFQDYRAVKLIADEVNQTLGRTVLDMGTYRAHGMLRCAYSAKVPASAEASAHPKRLLPLVQAKDAALQNKLRHMESYLRTITDPEILEMTFCHRLTPDAETAKMVRQHAAQLPSMVSVPLAEVDDCALPLLAPTRPRVKLIRSRHILGPQGAQAQEFDAYGNIVSPFLTEAAKWRRYKTVIEKMRNITPRASESFDTWVRVGLALHNFSNEDHVFEEWVRFSLRCPQKYSREACRKKWVQFERNPDALNWRRGFNYLNSTVWRQV